MSAATELFEQSFRAGMSTAYMHCNCGKIYFDRDNVGHVLVEKSEFDRLDKQVLKGQAIPLHYSAGILEFEGRAYADACTCWHPRAERLAEFLDSHSTKIAEYFKVKKERLTAQAKDVPTIVLTTPGTS